MKIAMLAAEYECKMCGGVFRKCWTDEEVRAEQEANGWGDLPRDKTATVCDVCYQQMIALDPPAAFNERQAKQDGDTAHE